MTIHRYFASLCIIALMPTAACGRASADDFRGVEAPATTVEYLNRLEKLGFSGTVLIARDGQPTLARGYGLSDREHEVSWDTSTIGDIGSITKQFTGAAILSLEEESRLNVNDSITKYFEGVPEDKRSISLHQLLTHTSGIVDLDGAGDYDPIERTEFTRRIMAQPLEFEPGNKYEYSNAGYSLLGAIIEIVSGQSYEQFVRDRLFLPNGMQRTGYQLPEWDTTRFVYGYTKEGPWGTILRKPMAKDGPYWVLRANGGIHSPVTDMLRWAEALLDGKVLSRASMERYWTPYADEGGGTFYGYGWSIDTNSYGTKVISHNGGNGVFFANMMIVPSHHLVIVMETNIINEMPLIDGIMETIGRHELLGEPFPETPDLEVVSDASVSSWSGSYRVDDHNDLLISTERQRLLITPRGQSAFSLLLSSEPVNQRRCDNLSARLDSIVAAYTSGDFEPMFQALEGRSPLERLKSQWTEQLARWVEEHGSMQRYEIVGTALHPDRDITLVRFVFERGNADRAYIWSNDEPSRLLGYSRRGLDPTVTCIPVRGGGFARWDPATGATRPLRIDSDGGHAHLRFGPNEQAFQAIR